MQTALFRVKKKIIFLETDNNLLLTAVVNWENGTELCMIFFFFSSELS